jgi:hypothetical protein
MALGAALTGLLTGDAATVGVAQAGHAAQPMWNEVEWPFLLDQWGRGRAFRCRATDCGDEISLYVRPKLGFCNCSTGVADDQELDRVGDIDLFGPHFAPLSDGHSVTVGWMTGRSRPYRIENAPALGQALAIGVNDKCDVVVATVAVNHDLDARVEDAALAFLNSETVLRWTKAELGL